ncbi:TPR-like protein [Punctularia strigosozonata HHB-11173 SS5]|uniref:TPR-like protein n=1 Tax=Punctularia strigosozonata (strain HHB-11173) TaxID=741275 RepID=UPI0004416B7D|nr:TPR-like protein [Punctularia strigosozonata HHB-11173 SS5]EIN06117.1 TPR-like protein [Punctularia strigosozonata HHB-11173 SS5]
MTEPGSSACGLATNFQTPRRPVPFVSPKTKSDGLANLPVNNKRGSVRSPDGAPIPRRLDASDVGWATSTTPHSTANDPAETEALQCLEQGTAKLEEGDVQAAKELYKRSVEIKRNASSLFNLGVTHYHLKEYDDAISAWKESIALQPSSPDAHTNLASAYIISPVARPDLALHHLHIATSLAPEDPEIAFNYAAVLEACGRLEEALEQYKRSKDNGVERAAMHIRNVSAKILGSKMKEAESAGGEKPGSDSQ